MMCNNAPKRVEMRGKCTGEHGPVDVIVMHPWNEVGDDTKDSHPVCLVICMARRREH